MAYVIEQSGLYRWANPATVPLDQAGLTIGERSAIAKLQVKAYEGRAEMLESELYYNSEQHINNLRIAIPPELEGLRTVVGWPRIAVDPLVDRLWVDGFRFPGETDADEDLAAVWRLNSMDSEQSMAFTDAFVAGRGFVIVGSPVEPGGPPLITVESPLNIVVGWDPRTRQPTAALQSYWQDDMRMAAVLLPDKTVHMVEDEGKWSVVDVDEHDFGRVPVVRLANTPRSHCRDGKSQITTEIKAITQSACRTLLGLEVAREFYSVPQKLILGATEEDFMDPDGNRKSAWSTYVSALLALGRNDDGELPEVKQFTTYDPSVFTKLIEMYASQMAGVLGAAPQELGLYTVGNPISAESASASQANRNNRARVKQAMFESGIRQAGQLALMFMNGGVLPKGGELLDVDWRPPEDLPLSIVSDAMQKQAMAGIVPATSDVVLSKLGYTAVERARLVADRAQDRGESLLRNIAQQQLAKAELTDDQLLKDESGNGAAVGS